MLDLHIHTTASDGQYSPQDTVRLAHAAGIKTMAVTDHDTIDGLVSAGKTAHELGIEFISGIEISAKGNRELHILGYGVDEENSELQAMCKVFRGHREERVAKIYSFLRERGVNLPDGAAEKFAEGRPAARPHFAQAMVEYGYCQTTAECFEKHLGTPEFDSAERVKCSPKEGIAAIDAAGGLAVLAHPALLKLEDSMLKSLVKELCSQGLRGIECYYSTHSPQQTAFYLELAEENDLLITAGSDFHGEKIKPQITLGADVPTQEGEALLTVLRAEIARRQHIYMTNK